jgi:hypothetical protein
MSVADDGSSGPNEPPSDVTRIDLAIDAGRVVDDLVRGVVEMTDGVLGGTHDQGRNWTQRMLGKLVRSEQHLVQAMSGIYGPEQLRKAADAADELVAAVHELGNARLAPAREACTAVTELGVRDIPAVLRDPEIEAPGVVEVHRQLSKILGVLSAARSRVVLAEMRAERPGSPAD